MFGGWYEDPTIPCEHEFYRETEVELHNRLVDAHECIRCSAVRLREDVVRLPNYHEAVARFAVAA